MAVPYLYMYFCQKTCMFCKRSTARFLAAGKGVTFAVEIYSFSSCTDSTAVSDTIMLSLFFDSEAGNAQQNSADILRNKHSISMLLTVTVSRGKNFDH